MINTNPRVKWLIVLVNFFVANGKCETKFIQKLTLAVDSPQLTVLADLRVRCNTSQEKFKLEGPEVNRNSAIK